MIERVHSDLLEAGAIVPVALGGSEERTWLDCDLASLAENRLGDLTDPRALDAERRREWQSRATTERSMGLQGRSHHEGCYWLIERGERTGTIALAKSTLGGARVRVSSFYVLPPFRGQGTGRRALGRVKEAVARHDLGIRLETSWCWPRAVRFYLDVGMWIYMWKRDLTFCWDPTTPPPRIEVGEREASLSVDVGDRSVTLTRARRSGSALDFDEPSASLRESKKLGEAYWNAPSTLSLALALHGWPLVRSEEEWKRSCFADAGPPEALAYKITLWEAWNRKYGWITETPRIAGLEYPTWDEFEALWEAQNRELLAREAAEGGEPPRGAG